MIKKLISIINISILLIISVMPLQPIATPKYQVINELHEDPAINWSLWREDYRTSYQDYIKNRQDDTFNVNKVFPSISEDISPSSSLIYIFVSGDIYEDISSELLVYTNDLETVGISSEIHTGDWGSPEDIRSYLQESIVDELVGCIMVGDIPSAWYELNNSGYMEEFPIDLIYMDLDGSWYDDNDNGIYDRHSGDIEPELWIRRLKADSLDGNEIDLIKNYFRKNHDFRSDIFQMPKKALVYIDDDWADPYGNKWNKEVGNAYPTRTYVSDKWTTTGEDYKIRLTDDYEFVHTAVHSSYNAHYFLTPDDNYNIVTYDDIRTLNLHALFYNLFCCSAARYVEDNYIAGWYVFSDSYALLTIGSTKIGGMWKSTSFYDSLGNGCCFGEAFKEWFIQEGLQRPDWFYGMTITGDPTLCIGSSDNNPPEKPTRPNGPVSGKKGETYEYISSSIDTDGDELYYLFDWGDETYSGWIGPYENGQEVTASKIWGKQGDFQIRVKAKDKHGLQSEWSDPLAVSMPKNKAIASSFYYLLEKFISRSPLLDQFLRSFFDISLDFHLKMQILKTNQELKLQ